MLLLQTPLYNPKKNAPIRLLKKSRLVNRQIGKEMVKMVWVRIREKFHGVVNPKPMWSKYKSLAHAKHETAKWNGLTSRDQLKILAVRKEKPVGIVRKYTNIYHETKRFKLPRQKRVVRRQSTPKDIFGGAFKYWQ